MSIKYPDIIKHSNTKYPIVDSNDILGSKEVSTTTDLYTISVRKLRNGTTVFVTDVQTTFILLDINNYSNSSGWETLSSSLFFTSLTDFPTVGQTNTLYFDETDNKLFYWNGSQYLQIQETLGRGIIRDVNNALTLDLESKSLPPVVITSNYTIFCNDGTTPYNPSTASITTGTITVEPGCKVTPNCVFKYLTPTSLQTLPLTTSGTMGTTLPPVNTDSSPYTNSGSFLTTNTTVTQSIFKPKSGLEVVSTKVQFAVGSDSSVSTNYLQFLNKLHAGYSTLTILNETQIKSLVTSQFMSGKGNTLNGIITASSEYFYYCYPDSFGDLMNIIMDGAAPILGAFTKLTPVTVNNGAQVPVSYNVYKTNSPGAFTNNSLQFI